MLVGGIAAQITYWLPKNSRGRTAPKGLVTLRKLQDATSYTNREISLCWGLRAE